MPKKVARILYGDFLCLMLVDCDPTVTQCHAGELQPACLPWLHETWKLRREKSEPNQVKTLFFLLHKSKQTQLL
jgi:hypothetical protein